MLSVRAINDFCRLLSDPTRVRMLALLEHHELTVAEVTEVIGLAQSRVSAHLGRLREAGLVQVRRQASASYYAARHEDFQPEVRQVWGELRGGLNDPLLETDRAWAQQLIDQRGSERSWLDSVAGRMERNYSPGRTWEGLARGLLGLFELGDVLDIASGDGATAELLAPRARSLMCVDKNRRVVEAATERLGKLPHVRVVEGDMHALPFDDARFDHCLLLNALTYSGDEQRVLAEAFRVLRPGGRLAGSTLQTHDHVDEVAHYDHLRMGFAQAELEQGLTEAGFEAPEVELSHREKRAPHFEIITFCGRRPR